MTVQRKRTEPVPYHDYDTSLSKIIPQPKCTCGWFTTCTSCKNFLPILKHKMDLATGVMKERIQQRDANQHELNKLVEENSHKERLQELTTTKHANWMKGIICIFFLVIAWQFVGFVFNLSGAVIFMTTIVTAISTVGFVFNK